MGITQKALAHGVPVVAVPFGRDQPEVSRRVEVAGAGVRLPLRKLRPDRLRKAVHDAIELRPGAERLARAFASAGRAAAAADARLSSPRGAMSARSYSRVRSSLQTGSVPTPEAGRHPLPYDRAVRA